MNEIILKFESEEDYKRFIEEVIEPSVINGQIEVEENDKYIVKTME